MRKTLQTALAATALFAVAGILSGPLAQDAPETQQPEKPAEEQAAPPPEGDNHLSGEVVLGSQYFADTDNRDSAKFEEFRDVPNGFVLPLVDFRWRPPDRTYIELGVVDVSERDQRGFVAVGRQDVWRGTVGWTYNPREWTDQAFQLFAKTGPGTFTLDDTLQAAVRAAPASVDADADLEWDPGTKGFIIKNAIAQGAQEVEVGHERKTVGFDLQYTPSRSVFLSLEGARDQRRGTAPQTLGMYFTQAPAEVAAPLDYRTDSGVATAEFQGRNFNGGVRLGAASFSTGYDSLRWDNQLFLVDEAVSVNVANPGRMQMSQAVDWRAGDVAVFGGVNLRGNTRIDVSFAGSRATQDEPFLPMTINTLLVPAPLPATSYDGEHTTTALRVMVNSRPTRSFRWGAWFRSYELDNGSPELTFQDYVQTDYQFPLCANLNVCDANGNGILDDRIARRSLPYSWKRAATGALAEWSPGTWFRGAVSYERLAMDREFSAVESSDEDIWKVVLDFDLAERLTARTTFWHQERRADEYDAEYFEESFPIGEPLVADVNEGMRRFYWTDRDRDAASLTLDLDVTSRLALYAEGTWAQNDYTDPNTGLPIGDSYLVNEDRDFNGIPETYNILLAGRTEDKSTSYSLGLTFDAGERARVYADYTWDTWKYGLETRYRAPVLGIGSDDPLDNWGSDVEDTYDTASLGFDLAFSEDRKSWLTLDASRSVGKGNIDTHFVPGGNVSGDTTLTAFPELDTKLTVATLVYHKRLLSNLGLSVGYWYESWKEENFASDFNQPYMGDPDNDPGSAQSIFLGMDFKNYTNHIVSAMLNWTF
jgi:MtrB/PioB family decaheme-associated outer membrane protein